MPISESGEVRDEMSEVTGDLLGESHSPGSDPRVFPAELAEEYEVVRELGRGGMAVVYLARDRELRREVAIKVVQAQYVANAEVLQRFAREARMVAGLDHANIVTLYSVRKLADNSLALIMQYVPGETLQQALERDGAFAFGRARQVLADIAQALSYAHARGIVHRDVKPENVFIDARTGRALLSDFGIARSGELDPRVTRTNVAIGTPAYMSPEQIDGGEIDGRSDLYSLGLVGWELIAGQQPWHGESLYGVIYRQKNDELPPLDELRRETPPELIAAVEGALEKSARVRWARADDFLDVLTGRVPPPPRRPRRTERRANTHDFVLPPELASLPTVEWRRGQGRGADADPGALVPVPAGEHRGPAAGAADDAPRGRPFQMPPEEPRPRRRLGLVAVLATAALSIGFAASEWQRRADDAPPPRRVAVADTAATVSVRVRPESAAGAIVTPPAPDSLPAGALGSVLDSVPAASSPLPPPAAESAAVSAPESTTAAPGRLAPRQPAAGTTARAPAESARPVETAAAPSGAAGGRAPAAVPAVPPPAPLPTPVAAAPTPAAGTGGSGEGGTVLTALSAATPTLAPGGSHTCEIAADGTALCWGANSRGQLGDGSNERRATPTAAATELRFTSIAAGLSHTCAVAVGGTAYCWGANELGQLGDGTLVAQDTPTRVKGLGRVRVLEAANSHSCAITQDGEAYCWGANSNGELGSRSDAVAHSTPVRVVSGSRFALLALGWNHGCALTTAGQAVCWGQGSRGQLGDGSTVEQRGPAAVVGSREYVSLASGSAHSCGVGGDGIAYCWGGNDYGQVGDGTTADRAVPTKVTGTPRLARVTAGSVHTCALTGGGAAYCWGRNTYGQLGDGTQTDRSTPVRVQSRESFVALRASGSHTCATTTTRRNVCWGYNTNGQLGDGTRNHRSRPVAVTAGS